MRERAATVWSFDLVSLPGGHALSVGDLISVPALLVAGYFIQS